MKPTKKNSDISSHFKTHYLQEEDYKPYYLESVQYVNDNLVILNVRPSYNYDIDFYHEIHIEAERENLGAFNFMIGNYIFIDLLSPVELEVHEGEFYSECSTNGSWKYHSFEFKTLQKASKIEWKSKYNELLLDFKKLFDQKVTAYKIERDKVAVNYQHIYLHELETRNTFGLSIGEIDKTHLFGSLYRLFNYNPAWDGLNVLIDPNYFIPQTPKDWKTAFSDLEKVFGNLKAVNVSDYSIIRDHMIERYRRSFDHQLPNLKYNHQEIDEQKYILFFEYLMEQLKRTTA